MADFIARSIMSQAAALCLSHPQASALEVLDLVMEGHHGSDLSFDATEPDQVFGDWTEPTSPFGELLRCAFAPDAVPSNAAQLWVSEDPKDDVAAQAVLDAWQTEVLDRFAERYKLWGS